MGKNKKRDSKDGLANRLFLMKPVKNGVGRFIPYCNYTQHQGIIINNKHKDCERKKCNHYIRFYLSYKMVDSRF